MTHRTTICPGPCNHRFRKAWDAYEQAYGEWELAHYRWTEARGWAIAAGNHTEEATLKAAEPQRPEPPDVRPVDGLPVWCGRCSSLIRSSLSELDDLAAILSADPGAPGHAPGDADRVSGTPGRGSVSPQAELVDEVIGDLTDAEDELRGRMGWPARPYRYLAEHGAAQRRSAPLLLATQAWLLAHLDLVLAADDDPPGRFGLRVLSLHRRLQAAAKVADEWTRCKAPCPRCRRRTLRRQQGGDRVECDDRDCGRMMTLDEYDELVESTTTQAKAAVEDGAA